jgi:glutamate synthase (NADPH/NADH) small chain
MPAEGAAGKVTNDATDTVSAEQLMAEFDAVLLAGGSETSRDLPVPGRELDGVHFAMEFLPQQNKVVAGDAYPGQIRADGKHVIVDRWRRHRQRLRRARSNRHGAASVTQFELMPHAARAGGQAADLALLALQAAHQLQPRGGLPARVRHLPPRPSRARAARSRACRPCTWSGRAARWWRCPGTEREYRADLVLLAMGFVAPVGSVLEAFGVDRDARGNARAGTDAAIGYRTNVDKVFAAGDMRRGQSLVVWAIREGRQAARAVDEYLMGSERAAALIGRGHGRIPEVERAPGRCRPRPLNPADLIEIDHVTFGYDASRMILQ